MCVLMHGHTHTEFEDTGHSLLMNNNNNKSSALSNASGEETDIFSFMPSFAQRWTQNVHSNISSPLITLYKALRLGIAAGFLVVLQLWFIQKWMVVEANFKARECPKFWMVLSFNSSIILLETELSGLGIVLGLFDQGSTFEFSGFSCLSPKNNWEPIKYLEMSISLISGRRTMLSSELVLTF